MAFGAQLFGGPDQCCIESVRHIVRVLRRTDPHDGPQGTAHQEPRRAKRSTHGTSNHVALVVEQPVGLAPAVLCRRRFCIGRIEHQQHAWDRDEALAELAEVLLELLITQLAVLSRGKSRFWPILSQSLHVAYVTSTWPALPSLVLTVPGAGPIDLSITKPVGDDAA